MTEPRFVVLGAGGGAGRALVHELADRGHEVRAVNRSGSADVPAGVEQTAADITTPDGAAAAVENADVVYMAAQPAYHRWRQEFSPMLRAVIDAVGGVDAHLIMVDNLYMYEQGAHPISETTPESNDTKKGRARAGLARMLRSAHETGRARVTIGRASDYFGPGADTSAITTLSIRRAVAGKPIRWMGRLDNYHSVAYLPDVARAYALLGESGNTDGDTWILPHGEPPTGAGFLAAVNASLPRPVETGTLSPTLLRIAAPFHTMSRESLETMYQWTEDFVVDDASFREAYGPFETTPLDDAVHATVEWYANRSARVHA